MKNEQFLKTIENGLFLQENQKTLASVGKHKNQLVFPMESSTDLSPITDQSKFWLAHIENGFFQLGSSIPIPRVIKTFFESIVFLRPANSTTMKNHRHLELVEADSKHLAGHSAFDKHLPMAMFFL